MKGKREDTGRPSYFLQKDCSKSLILGGAKKKKKKHYFIENTLSTKNCSPQKTAVTELQAPSMIGIKSNYQMSVSYVDEKASRKLNAMKATRALLLQNLAA